ncbi:MAG: DUF814 domain-containing protein [Oligoflexia bacterium]|nr:DUF814 domain-containing protein [Oligoflexia bacterium]
MIQKLFELQNEVNLFKNEFNPSEPAQIQKLFSTGRFICITIRLKGITKYLYLGRGKGYEGLYIGESLPPKELRIKDNFLEYLRKYLVSARLIDLKVDPQDRILIMNYKYMGYSGCMLFFWSARQFYLSNFYYKDFLEKKTLFLSWKGNVEVTNKAIIDDNQRELIENELLNCFVSVGRIQDDRMKNITSARKNISIEDMLKKELEECLRVTDSKKKKSLQRKLLKISTDYENNKKWRDVKSAIENSENSTIDLNDNKREVEIAGVVFKFADITGYYKRIDFIYKKIKKLKRGETILQERIKNSKEELDKVMNIDSALQASKAGIKVYTIDQSKIVRPIWFNKIKIEKTDEVSELSELSEVSDISEMSAISSFEGDKKSNSGSELFVEFKLRKNLKCSVGKNDRGNDFLRTKWANKEDLWFHMDGYKGAHLIVKVKSIGELSTHELQIIGSILNDYSKAKITVIPLVFTQVKNIKGVKGQSGLVTLSKQKYIQAEYEKNWRELLEKSLEG